MKGGKIKKSDAGMYFKNPVTLAYIANMHIHGQSSESQSLCI